MHFLFLFLDGVGLGSDDLSANPFAAAEMPIMQSLLGGKRLLRETAPYVGPLATLLALDAGLGVDGLPQSATGQAALVTGRNVPAEIGAHFGPKPNADIAHIVKSGNLFKTLWTAGKSAALINAYPPRYFQGIASGRRLYSSIPLAVTSGGFALKTETDLYEGNGMSVDFTGHSWREHLGYTDSPVHDPVESGQLLAALVRQTDFAFFEYWISDYVGHNQDMPQALEMLARFDRVLAGLLEAWDPGEGLILITSDHGNLEDLSTRRHTANPVPCLVIGEPERRREFTVGLHDLTGIAPAILRVLGV
ncbi:MAG TPA: alkaline phosphatase family protein [Anaerolineales bacterium]|nr:alkaline phosphatase family protein [Anaerolineales bacterium]